MKYAWIERHRKVWPVSLACQVLGVSPSGYHERNRRERGPGNGPRRGLSNDALLVHIRAVHAESKGEYGWPRVWKELLARGVRVGRQRVQKLMQLHGIKARSKRKYKATTDSHHSLPIAPNAAWSSDITYIATDEGRRYLAVVIDLFSRQVFSPSSAIIRVASCGAGESPSWPAAGVHSWHQDAASATACRGNAFSTFASIVTTFVPSRAAKATNSQS